MGRVHSTKRVTLRKSDNKRRRNRKLVAFCGTRGLPANYGGFETAIDHITRYMLQAGMECDVFCRRSGGRDEIEEYNGCRLHYVNGSRYRKLDTFVSAIQTGLQIWRRRKEYSCVMWFNNANLPGILITALSRVPMVVNTDGLEWRREKWSLPFKAYYYLSSWIVTLLGARLVSDSHGIRDYYANEFAARSEFIPYGAPEELRVPDARQKEVLRSYGLESGKYFLQITRLEPDNLPLDVAHSFVESKLEDEGYRCLFIGYKQPTSYARKLKELDGRHGILVHEACYDQEVLYTLRRHCLCYVHGNSVGGTNPALLEAMSVCPRIAAIDIDFSQEVLGPFGLRFTRRNLAQVLRRAVTSADQSSGMQARIEARYRWDEVSRSYGRLADGMSADYRVRKELDTEFSDDATFKARRGEVEDVEEVRHSGGQA